MKYAKLAGIHLINPSIDMIETAIGRAKQEGYITVFIHLTE